MKKFLFICLIFNFAILNAQEDFLCNAINVFNSLGTDAYTEDGVWKQGRSSVLIENTNEDNKYEWNKLQDKNTNGSVLKLNIIKDKKVIQKIEYHYPEEYFGNSIYVEEPFEITDVNFDGFDDILIYLGSYGNQGVVYKDCFLWDVKKQKFENCSLFKDIPNPQIDESEKYIYGNIRNSSSHYEYEAFIWDGNGLKCKFKIHEVYSAMQLVELYNMDIPEEEDSGEYMLEYFDLDLALNDSVFYVKISYDNGKIEISKPAVEVFSDIPEKLKKNIK